MYFSDPIRIHRRIYIELSLCVIFLRSTVRQPKQITKIKTNDKKQKGRNRDIENTKAAFSIRALHCHYVRCTYNKRHQFIGNEDAITMYVSNMAQCTQTQQRIHDDIFPLIVILFKLYCIAMDDRGKHTRTHNLFEQLLNPLETYFPF